MYIEDYFDVVNTGERLYSVILDEDELRLFDETSSEEEEKSSDKKKNITKGAIIAGSGLGGAATGYLGVNCLGKKIAVNLSKRNILKKGKTLNGTHYSASVFKNDPNLLKQVVEDDAMRSLKSGSRGLAIAGGLAAGYGAYRLLKNRNKKKDNKE